MPRVRRVGSVKQELVTKSREAALSAVQIFNNPLIVFKSEMFIVNMVIAWTYLLHSYYRRQGIEYRYHEVLPSGRKKYDKTKNGAHKYWELERCLNDDRSPIDHDSANNLRFLIGLRHEIEHQMTSKIDDALSARFQACCLNYNEVVKKLFGDDEGIDKYLSFSLQFSSLSESQVEKLNEYKELLPRNILRFVEDYDGNLSDDEFNSPKFAYRVLYTQKMANRRGQADKVIEFIPAGSEAAKDINKAYAVVKEKEKTKYRATTIVDMMHAEGFSNFKVNHHTKLWQKHDGKNPTKGYGVEVEKYWYWYEDWLSLVKQHCESNRRRYE